MGNKLDNLNKELGKLTTQREELKAKLARAKSEADSQQAAMGEAVLSGADPEKLADQVRRLELQAIGLSKALERLEGMIKAQAEAIAQEQHAQAVDQLAKIDAQAAEAFDQALDTLYQAVEKLQSYGALAGDCYRLASQFNLSPGTAQRLDSYYDPLLGAIADGLSVIRRSRPELLKGRPEVKRRPVGSAPVKPYEPKHEVGVSPISWLGAPKPGEGL